MVGSRSRPQGQSNESFLIIPTYLNNVTGNGNSFVALGGSGKVNQSGAELTTSRDMVLRRVRVNMSANTKNADTIIAVVDDGVDVTGSSITIPAADVTERSTAELNVVIAAGSKICIRHNTTTATTGGITMGIYIEFLVR